MLSDEEKQVVDYLIFHKYENSSKKEDMIDKVIEIIEKQSKEIEELKEKNGVLQNELNKKIEALDKAMNNPDYICKDKIKAILNSTIRYATDTASPDLIQVERELESLIRKT